jgi:hypothetical protein
MVHVVGLGAESERRSNRRTEKITDGDTLLFLVLENVVGTIT